MAAGAAQALADDQLQGVVVAPPGLEPPPAGVQVLTGSHPIPDRHSLDATAALLIRLQQSPAAQPLLVLISGGASSLLVQPRPPVTLAEKVDVTRRLLACGAPIASVNAVRKHLSLVKGGGLLRAAGARPVRTLLLSDVAGDDPSVIGSGPTVADPTRYADAWAVLQQYDLLAAVAPAVRTLLDRGRRGLLVETLKPDDPLVAGAEVAVVGSNALALTAAAAAARGLGYDPLVRAQPLAGDTTADASAWAFGLPTGAEPRRWCAIAGGETTVVVRGSGRGGRNQEFALAMAAPLAGSAVAALSAGTDGIDGPTDAAGAFVDGGTLQRARAIGLDVSRALADNDSYTFFDRLGDLLRSGPTGTNVMDIKIAVGVGSAR